MKKNPHRLIFLNRSRVRTLESLRRVDPDGLLYEMNYTADCYKPAVVFPVQLLKLMKSGSCSCFSGRSPASSVLVGRNYDVPHKDKEGGITGLNVVFTLHPRGKFRSVNFADAAWVSMLGLPYQKGALDDGKTGLSPLLLIPYLTMDGMNEKGLCASILALDLKQGEKAVYQTEKGKKKVMITMLLRYMLDSCETIQEAEDLARKYNMVNTFGYDYHLFLADASGRSAVLEWRYNSLQITETDAVTNFYVSSDDAEDSYLNGKLKERFINDLKTEKSYRFGYGHGYERFKEVARTLDSRPHENGAAILTEEESLSLLSRVSQDYTGELTSMTQYSVLYDLTQKTATVSVQQKYEDQYLFRL